MIDTRVIQSNPTVGDVVGNAEQIEQGYREAAADGADLVVTSELAVLGYPPRDLLNHDSLLASEAAAVSQLAELTGECGVPLIVGHSFPVGEGELRNSASVLRNGEITARYDKRLLPTYDVFDEQRYFSSGDSPTVVTIDGVDVGITICEDAWYRTVADGKYAVDPMQWYASGVDVIVNLSASPFSVGKPESRVELFSQHAQETDSAVVVANQVGGNDDILFDGASFFVDSDGTCFSRGAFAQPEVVSDVQYGVDWPADTSQLRLMIELGIRDYVQKTGFDRVVVGLSGGIDSSVTAALAASALGPESVTGVSLPSRFTKDENITDPEVLADRLGIKFSRTPIAVFPSTPFVALSGSVARTHPGYPESGENKDLIRVKP